MVDWSIDSQNKYINRITRADFSDQFSQIIIRYTRIGHEIKIMRQSPSVGYAEFFYIQRKGFSLYFYPSKIASLTGLCQN